MGPQLAVISARCAELAPWLSGALVAVSVGVLSNGLHESLQAWLGGIPLPRRLLVSSGGSLLVFVLGAWALYRSRGMLYAPRTRYMTNESPEKRGHLVIFLSHLRTDREKFADGVPMGIQVSGDLEADLAELVRLKDRPAKEETRIQWSWEMPLRAIRHHVGKLRTLVIVCSEESIQQIGWFVAILRKYPALASLSVWAAVKADDDRADFVSETSALLRRRGWNFEAFDDLSRAVLEVIRFLGQQGIREKEIMIDFTGGQKVTSVVAAAVTFNRPTKTQYVQTNYPYRVISYDILLGTSDTGGIGM